MLLAKNGSDVALLGVTPAEVLLLRAIHQKKLGRDPITDLKASGEVKRSGAEEKTRLLQKYKAVVVEKLFPGITPTMPDDFDKAAPSEPVETPKLTTTQPK